LLNIIDDWSFKLDSGGQIDCIYMDFEKAFKKGLKERATMADSDIKKASLDCLM